MTLSEKQQEFIDLFNDLGEWPNRFNYLIALVDELPAMPTHLVIPENKIQRCISQTYFCCTYTGDVAHIYGQSNAAIPCGIIAVIKDLFQGYTREEIRATPITFHTDTELLAHLTASRADALLQMIDRITS